MTLRPNYALHKALLLNAFVVRIEKKNTVLSLPYLDRSMQETLSGYLERIEDAA
jgi:hypothetical protein